MQYISVMENLLYTLTPFQFLHDINVNKPGQMFRSIVNTELFDSKTIQRIIENFGSQALVLIHTGIFNRILAVEEMI
jgi:hypothetical protein